MNLMGWQNTTFFMMTEILTRENDFVEINSLEIKLQHFQYLYSGMQNDFFFFFACISMI